MADIAAYTLSEWGESQMLKYVASLKQCAQRLARNPKLGRPCEHILAGLFRFEKERHVLFYIRVSDGILIARILHQSMEPGRHEFKEEAED